MPKQFGRNFGHKITSATQGEVMVLYKTGRFPAPATTEKVIGQINTLFCESWIDKPPIANANNWSGISGELLIAPNGTDDWQPVLNVDFPSTNEVRRQNIGLLAWEGNPSLLGSEAQLGFRLVNRGHGFLPAGAFISIWGAALEVSEEITGGATIVDDGNGGGNETLTASEIVALLEGLSGSARLNASAIEGLSNGQAAAVADPVTGVQFNRDGNLSADQKLTFQPAAIPLSGDWLASSGISYTQLSATASSTSAQLNDGSLSGGIATEIGAGQWVKADLGTAKLIDGVQLGGGVVGAVNVQSWSPQWTIQTSVNGADWTQVAVPGVVNNGEFKTISFTQTLARYVRILNPSNTNVGVGTSEFRIRGTANEPGGLLALKSSGLWVGHTSDPAINPDVGVISASVALNSQQEIRLAGQPVIKADGIYVNGIKVIGARQTGWTAGTGTPLTGVFNAATATLPLVAQRVLAIEQALRAHGLIN